MRKLFIHILETLPFVVVFLSAIKFPKDSDLGWHLKQGEYFAQTLKIMDVNVYSQNMAGFHYRNYTWLTDLLEYTVFHLFSFWGLALLGAFTILLIYIFISKALKFNLWQKALTFPIIIYLSDIVLRVSFRGQILSLAFTALVIYLLSIFKFYPNRVIIIMTLLVLIWANTHAEFLIAPILISFWIFSNVLNEFVEKRNINLQEYKMPALLLIVSVIPTLINPYGINVYASIFAHFYNPEVLNKVSEWLSPFTEKETTLILIASILAYTFSLTGQIYKKTVLKNLFYILIPIPFYLQAFQHARYLWIAIFMTLPILGLCIELIKPKNTRVKEIIAFSAILISYVAVILFFPFKDFIKPTWETHCIYIQCSDKAIKFLVENKLNNETLFTQFEYGGWMIWTHPEVKPSIDGRMHTWNDKGQSAFLKYFYYEQNGTSINNSQYQTVLIGKRKPITKEMAKLAKKKQWKLVYEDFYNQIYIRNN